MGQKLKWYKQTTHNRPIVGSNPSWPTIYNRIHMSSQNQQPGLDLTIDDYGLLAYVGFFLGIATLVIVHGFWQDTFLYTLVKGWGWLVWIIAWMVLTMVVPTRPIVYNTPWLRNTLLVIVAVLVLPVLVILMFVMFQWVVSLIASMFKDS